MRMHAATPSHACGDWLASGHCIFVGWHALAAAIINSAVVAVPRPKATTAALPVQPRMPGLVAPSDGSSGTHHCRPLCARTPLSGPRVFSHSMSAVCARRHPTRGCLCAHTTGSACECAPCKKKAHLAPVWELRTRKADTTHTLHSATHKEYTSLTERPTLDR